MYGMEQQPAMVDRVVVAMKLRENGLEALCHDASTDGTHLIRLSVFRNISTWRNHLVAEREGLRIAYDDDGQHIYVLRVEVVEGCYLYGLAFTTSLADVAYRSISASSLAEENLFQTS